VLKNYADMIVYAVGPARLVPAMCHRKLPTTIVTSQATFDTSFSLWWLRYMQLAHACPTMSPSMDYHRIMASIAMATTVACI